MARVWPNPESRIAQIDKMLMFLGRYSNQPASLAQHEPVDVLRAWARETATLLREEADAMKRAHGGK